MLFFSKKKPYNIKMIQFGSINCFVVNTTKSFTFPVLLPNLVYCDVSVIIFRFAYIDTLNQSAIPLAKLQNQF